MIFYVKFFVNFSFSITSSQIGFVYKQKCMRFIHIFLIFTKNIIRQV